MKTFQIQAPGLASLVDSPELNIHENDVRLRVALVGMCGTDLTTFRGNNAMVEFPRVPGHEVSGTVLEGGGDLSPGTRVTVSP